MESTRIETQQSREFLATDMEWTADLEERTGEKTADLRDENIAERAPTVELPRAPVPTQHALGFFAFAACTLAAVLVTTERPTEPSPPSPKITFAASSVANAPEPARPHLAVYSAEPDGVEEFARTQSIPSAAGTQKNGRGSVPLGVVTFESHSFVTSEKAVAAVFIVRRTQVVRGAAVVHWAARSGSADAGIDFSDASGKVRFADGQRERAIYVPLRNDLLKEEDEKFKVCLRSPWQARISGGSCAEATIRDDDAMAKT